MSDVLIPRASAPRVAVFQSTSMTNENGKFR